MKGEITIVETKQRLGESLLEVERVLYGKKGVAEKDKEFKAFNGSPVGNESEWLEFAKGKNFAGCMFIDAVEKVAYAIYNDGKRINIA